jgi:HemX protein
MIIAIAQFVASLCYVGAAALAAAPMFRPVTAPVRAVTGVLATGVVAHAAALVLVAFDAGRAPMTGLGPALSFGALLLATTLLITELSARDTSLSLIAAPLAAAATLAGAAVGMTPLSAESGLRGAWLYSHIALSFIGLAAFGTAAAAGAIYLVERRELRSRRFGALFRLFPPLETLDRVNHVASVAGWLALSLGIALAIGYSLTYRVGDASEAVWGTAAWLSVTALTIGRLLGWWRAHRAATAASAAFVVVVVLYVALRAFAPGAGASSGAFL